MNPVATTLCPAGERLDLQAMLIGIAGLAWLVPAAQAAEYAAYLLMASDPLSPFDAQALSAAGIILIGCVCLLADRSCTCRWLLAYAIMVLQGLASAIPWNVYITETEYFNLRAHQPPTQQLLADNLETIELLVSQFAYVHHFNDDFFKV